MTSLDRAQALTREALAEVRHSVAALRASPLEGRSLPEALASAVGECRRAGLPTGLVVAGDPWPLPTAVCQALFRAAQEGLTNAHKHARASQAEVTRWSMVRNGCGWLSRTTARGRRRPTAALGCWACASGCICWAAG